jgi:hypothetical protein
MRERERNAPAMGIKICFQATPDNSPRTGVTALFPVDIKGIVEVSPVAELLATHETNDSVPFVPAGVEVEAGLCERVGVCEIGRRVRPFHGGRGGEGWVLDAFCVGEGATTKMEVKHFGGGHCSTAD